MRERAAVDLCQGRFAYYPRAGREEPRVGVGIVPDRGRGAYGRMLLLREDEEAGGLLRKLVRDGQVLQAGRRRRARRSNRRRRIRPNGLSIRARNISKKIAAFRQAAW